MSLIAEITACASGDIIEGTYRLGALEEHSDVRGRPYVRLRLEDRSGALWAYCWQERLEMARALRIGEPVSVTLAVRRLNGNVKATLLDAAPLTGLPANPIRLLPAAPLPRPDLAARLERLIDHCPLEPLQDFLRSVFSDEDLSRPFLRLPASAKHHHSWPGGLAEHSLEVAEIVYRASVLDSPAERHLGLIAGLLHDVGKIRTHHDAGRRNTLGYLVSHDSLTFEILGPALAGLEQSWADGAMALRYLLNWRSDTRDYRPLIPIAMAVRHADRYSAASSARRLADHQRTPRERFARLPAPGPDSRFWYPRPPRTSSAAVAVSE